MSIGNQKFLAVLSNHKKVTIFFLLGSTLFINYLIGNYTFSLNAQVKQELSDLRINLNANFTEMNLSRWIVPSFQNESFLFEIETYSQEGPWYVNTTNSVSFYDMGTTEWFKNNCTEWGEWGYAFHHLTDGQLDGSGVPHYGGYPIPPGSKREACDYMKNYVVNFTEYLNGNKRPWISFNGHYPYHHYAAEFGFDKIGTEVGENMESYQMLMAFNRGAARQYQLPWFVDVSAWYGAGITDYNDPTIWPEYGGPDNGHSLSLYRRTYYMAYMAGASRLIAEGGCFNFFYQNQYVEPGGIMKLTPLGEIGKEFAHFSKNFPHRGIPYTPVGVLIDEFHGTTGLGVKKTFNSLPYEKGDGMTYDLLGSLFPGGWENKQLEKCQLVNSEFGDIFDILLQNASLDVLNCYPIIIMSGDIDLDKTEQERLINYVENGGTLVVNSAYFNQLNQELERKGKDTRLLLNFLERVKLMELDSDGAGNYILYNMDHEAFKLNNILSEITNIINPFIITSRNTGEKTKIQHLINRNENGWILTLINNDGFTKTHHNPPVVDYDKGKEISISINDNFMGKYMPGLALSQIECWTENQTLWKPSDGNFDNFELIINPGDLSIIEFQYS